MGLMDKVKQQASTTAKQAQGKIDQLQEKRKVDQLLHDLGALYYASRKGTASGDSSAEMDRLIGEIASHQANIDSSGD